jgi:ribonuclease R
VIGRAWRSDGGWVFDPAQRWRFGRHDLDASGPGEVEHGDYCIAEVSEDGTAFLVEVLGADDRPEWDDAAVASQFRLSRRFPATAESEAGGFSEPGDAERRGREDLRRTLVFTIDPEDARDHDDALSVSDRGDGTWEVGVHIADVSHYVTPGSALDAEAQRRGTSCYLPGGVIPMLPERLSSDLCSLRPQRDRLALSVFVTLDAEGEQHGVRMSESVVCSRHKLHYGEVQDSFDAKGVLDPELGRALDRLRRLAAALRSRRMEGGALDLEVPEVKARVDAHGVPLAIERRPHFESHELIEEFMLLANRCVGHEGTRRRSRILFRVHDPPAPEKLHELEVALKALGLPRLGGGSDPAPALQALLRAPLDPGPRRLLHRMVLRSLTRACYLERDHGHFGLATREYCHFTSPIRRYPDLHNHRRVREWIRRQRSAAWDPVALAELATRCSETEQNATEAEREATRVKALRVLATRLGDTGSGMITGLTPRGFFVELDDMPAEGFVRISNYIDDAFVLDATGVCLVGRRSGRRFAMGDAVDVTIARVDVPARECDLALVVPKRRGRR